MPCTLGRFYFCLVCVFCCAVVTRALSVGHPVSQLCVAAQHTHTHGQSELFAACCRRAALGSFLPSSTSSPPPPISRWSVGGKRPELIQKEEGWGSGCEILGPALDDHDTARQTTSRSKKAHKNWPASIGERALLLANIPPFI